MRYTRFLTLGLVTLLLCAASGFAQSAQKLPTINVKEFKLKNGLRVLLHSDRSTPIVTVGTWYHVGSKNETPGRTGFAHLFEHMMFQGSGNYDSDYFTPLQEAGGSINGTTNPDRTWYFETMPSNFLELALFMEADRLANLLPAMTQEKLDNQRDVVKNDAANVSIISHTARRLRRSARSCIQNRIPTIGQRSVRSKICKRHRWTT